MQKRAQKERSAEKISRRTAVKRLIGVPLILLSTGCAPFGSSSTSRERGFPTPSAPYPTAPAYPSQDIYTYSGHTKGVSTVAWAPDGKRIASGSVDTTVQIWDSPHGGNVFTYSGNSGGVVSLAWSPDGYYIASGSGDNTVTVFVA